MEKHIKFITKDDYDDYEHQIVLASAANLLRQSKKLIYRFRPTGCSTYVVLDNDKPVYDDTSFDEAIKVYNSIHVKE